MMVCYGIFWSGQLRLWNLNICIEKVDAKYATCTSPIMHLICPQNFASALFSVSLGTAVIPRRNEKQRLCKIFGGK